MTVAQEHKRSRPAAVAWPMTRTSRKVAKGIGAEEGDDDDMGIYMYKRGGRRTPRQGKDCEDRLSGDHHLVTYHCFALVNTQQWRRVLLRPPSSLVLRDRDRGVKCKEKIGLDGATAVAIVLGTWPTL